MTKDYCKVWQALQSEAIATKWDVTRSNLLFKLMILEDIVVTASCDLIKMARLRI